MANKKEDTASFLIRFTQKIYQSEDGTPEVQWRGNIRHVQSGDEKRFVAFEKAMQFMQTKLESLTEKAAEFHPEEEQPGIIEKGFSLWKKVARETPNFVMTTIKDPKKGVAQIQQQINEVRDDFSHQIEERIEESKHQIEEKIGRKLNLDEWTGPSKNDFQQLVNMMQQMQEKMNALERKIDGLPSSKKKK